MKNLNELLSPFGSDCYIKLPRILVEEMFIYPFSIFAAWVYLSMLVHVVALMHDGGVVLTVTESTCSFGFVIRRRITTDLQSAVGRRSAVNTHREPEIR